MHIYTHYAHTQLHCLSLSDKRLDNVSSARMRSKGYSTCFVCLSLAATASAFISACNRRHLRQADVSSWIFEKAFRSKVTVNAILDQQNTGSTTIELDLASDASYWCSRHKIRWQCIYAACYLPASAQMYVYAYSPLSRQGPGTMGGCTEVIQCTVYLEPASKNCAEGSAIGFSSVKSAHTHTHTPLANKPVVLPPPPPYFLL